MIVRTYSRRSRGIPTLKDNICERFAGTFSQEIHQDIYNFGSSSQESSPWSFDSDSFGSSQDSVPLVDTHRGVIRKAKKGINVRKNCGLPVAAVAKVGWMVRSSSTPHAGTSTLMETQEFGEMMEHEDEMIFALDGLEKGQPVRIRRASLLTLLSICATTQRRKLIRSNGMVKKIVDAIMSLNFDDSPTSLAAAALFYILTSYGQDEHLLESPNYIQFLLKLLKPIICDSSKEKLPSIGHRLLALHRNADILQDRMKSLDSSSASITHKVQEILVKAHDLKSFDGNSRVMGRSELSPKWIALLIMEKASLTTVSLEETTGTMRKTGGSFKEKLREVGGLDAVFDIVLNCHSVIKGRIASPSLNSKDDADSESLVLLLKSLKIMENATFLSKDNQTHLLRMRGSLDHQNSSFSFTELILSVIKVLSERDHKLSDEIGHTMNSAIRVDSSADRSEALPNCLGMERTSSEKSSDICQNSQYLSAASSSEVFASFHVDNCFPKKRTNSSGSCSCSVASRSSINEKLIKNSSKKDSVLGKRPCTSDLEEDTEIIVLDDSGEDPFAFNEVDYEPWDLLSDKPKASQSLKGKSVYREPENGFESQLMTSQQESCTDEKCHSHETNCLGAADVEIGNPLGDCLLTAVKVLMNLTNDNSVGCQQIAACGGLETMSSLIGCLFPLFILTSSSLTETKENDSLQLSKIVHEHQHEKHLTDQQLDFLVAILGLLVNLVEKDSHNRSRLAAASVLLPGSEGLSEDNHKDVNVIPLLCSIFLANRGAGEAAVVEEGSISHGKDEASLLIGEKEAEQTIIEAYAALLLAFLSAESKSIRGSIAERLPGKNVSILVPVLERFLAFHLTLDMISPETHTIVSKVIESCRLPR